MFEGSTPTYFVGIDVALRANHVAVILDERCRPVGKKLSFGHTYQDLQGFHQQVYQALPPQAQVVWGCEATGAAWRPLTAYLGNNGESFSLENAATVAALRDVNSRHFKTDQIDARTIAETLQMRVLRGRDLRTPPPPAVQAQRSLLRRVNGIKENEGAAQTRALGVLCDTLLPGLNPAEHAWLGASLVPVLMRYADPRQIAGKSLKAFVQHARKLGGSHVPQQALCKLHEAAKQSLQCYGCEGLQWEVYAMLLRDTLQELLDLRARLQPLQQELDRLIAQGCSPQVRDCGLSVPGVGPESIQVALALCGAPADWPCFKAIKHFAGAVPIVRDSGTTHSTPRMSKLGEPILRKLIYQLGDNGRRWDAQFAAHYHDQMVHKGKCHVAACFSTGLKVLNILRAVMRDQRAYDFRDPQTGQTITKQQSRELAQTTYRVPEEIRAARRKQKRDSDRKQRANEGHAEALPNAG
jgi:transposase